jgi:hypothetical protein
LDLLFQALFLGVGVSDVQMPFFDLVFEILDLLSLF